MVLIEEIDEDDVARCLRLKQEGNVAYKRKEYTRAREKYTEALQLSDSAMRSDASLKAKPSLKAQLLSNRCQVIMCMCDWSAALEDAIKCAAAADTWAKAHHRLGTVLAQKQQFREAYEAFDRAAKLEPADQSLQKACQDAYATLVEREGPPEVPEALTGGEAAAEADTEAGAVAGAVARAVARAGGASDAAADAAAGTAGVKPDATPPESDAKPEGAAVVDTAAQPSEPEHKLTVEGSELVLTASMPLVASMKHLTVQISSATVSLEVPQLYVLNVELPRPIDDAQARARFDRKARTFVLRAPLLDADEAGLAAAA